VVSEAGEHCGESDDGAEDGHGDEAGQAGADHVVALLRRRGEVSKRRARSRAFKHDCCRGYGTCILLRTAPICTDMALGGMHARNVTRPKRRADMGSSGDATLNSHPGISGESRRELQQKIFIRTVLAAGKYEQDDYRRKRKEDPFASIFFRSHLILEGKRRATTWHAVT
jgi:hypothetical protein